MNVLEFYREGGKYEKKNKYRTSGCILYIDEI